MISFLRLMHRPSCKVRSSRDSKGRLTPIFFSLLMTLVHAGAQDVVQEPARQTPVLYDVDVVVIGGGKSGVGAAVGAARMGARTLLIERTGYLGSGYRSLGLGMRLGIRGFRPSLRQAILRDVAERLVEIATPPACLDFVWTLPEAARGLAPGSVTADPRGATTPQPLQECPDLETLSGNEYIAISHHELLPYVFQSLVREAGAQILFFSTYVGAIVEPDPRAGYGSWLHGGPERTIQAVIVQTPTDRFAVRGRIFVDCTGLTWTVTTPGPEPVPGRETKPSRPGWRRSWADLSSIPGITGGSATRGSSATSSGRPWRRERSLSSIGWARRASSPSPRVSRPVPRPSMEAWPGPGPTSRGSIPLTSGN